MKPGKIRLVITASLLVLLLSACEQTAESTAEKTTDAALASATAAVPATADAANNAEAKTSLDASAKPKLVSVTELFFQESEHGSEPYVTRMLVNENFIRIDEAGAAEGYVLFDRKKLRIFSVLHDSERILVVDPVRPLGEIPADLRLTEKVLQETDAPAVDGIKPKHHQFSANDILCYSVIALDGFLPHVTSALKTYHGVLAAQQQETLDATPKELQTPCYRANYVYAAESHISKGFPFEQWDIEGHRRSFMQFNLDKNVDSTLFTLPEGYEFFMIGSGGGTTIM